MGALPEEVECLKNDLKNVTEKNFGNRTYYLGTLYGKEVVLTFAKYGKVAAALTTTVLIHEFKVKSLIFTGLAASLKPEIKVGDIVVAKRLYQHDMDTRPLFKKYEVPLTGKDFFETDKKLTELAKKASEKALESLKESLSKSTREQFFFNDSKIFMGDIASGDQFVTDSDCNNGFLEDKKETLAVEMEGASVAQVCSEYSLPFTVVRSISDCANGASNVDFLSFLKEACGEYSRAVVKNFLQIRF